MKVLIVSDSPSISTGYGKIVAHNVRHLIKQGHEVLILGHYPVPDSYPFQEEEWEGARLWKISTYGNLELIRWFLGNERPDVVLLNADPRFFYYLFKMDNEIRRLCPIVYYHIWDDLPFPNFNEMWYNCCDRIVAASKFTYDLFSKHPTFDKTKINYAPIGIDSTVYHPVSQEEKLKFSKEISRMTNGESDNKFVLGVVGRNAPRKLLLTMLDTYVAWSADKPDTMLFIHSPLSDEEGVLKLAMDTLYPHSNVVISNAVPGGQPDETINLYYNYFDVVLNRSYNEGFGLPIAEAMLAGTPSIAVDNPGPAGLITSETGWLVKGDLYMTGEAEVPYLYVRYAPHDRWNAALDEAYYNRDLLKQKGSKCRQHIVDNYSVAQMCEGLESALLTAIKEHTPYPDYTVTTYPYPTVEEPSNV